VFGAPTKAAAAPATFVTPRLNSCGLSERPASG